MKCDKCGFIYNKKVDVCPYCGNLVKKKKMSFFDRYVPLGNYSRMSVRSIIYIICVNFFLLGIILDLFFGFYSGYYFSIYGYAIGFGLMTIIGVLTRSKGLMHAFERINLFAVGLFVLLLILLPTQFVTMAYFVIPLYFIISTITATTFCIAERKSIQPLKTIGDGLLNWLFSLAILIFLLVSLTFQSTETISLLDKIIVYVSFIATSLFLFNTTLFIAARVISETRRPYGK
jgi:hypothetical protein